jgi:hypothetical protein
MTTVREAILATLATAIAEATVANGYTFNLGTNVYRGKPQVNAVPAVVIFDGRTNVTEVPRAHTHSMDVTIEGHVSVAAETAVSAVRNTLANAVLGDLIKVIFAEFSMDGVVINLVSYFVAHDTELTDSVGASVSLRFVWFTPRNDPLTLKEV